MDGGEVGGEGKMKSDVSIQYFVENVSKIFLSKKGIIKESCNICRVTAYIGPGNLSTFTWTTKDDLKIRISTDIFTLLAIRDVYFARYLKK